MSTKTAVEEIKRKAPNRSSDGGTAILQMMDRAQRYLFSRPCSLTMLIDESTGTYPIITTVDGTKKYSLTSAVVSLPTYSYTDDNGVARTPSLRVGRVLGVFSDTAPASDYGFGLSRGVLGVSDDKVFYKITATPGTEVVPASVVFSFNPGTSDDRFKLYALVEPLRLTSDTIPLMVPMEWEYLIVLGAIGFIQEQDYGKSDAIDRFYAMAKDFWYAYKLPNVSLEYRGTPNRKF